MMIYHRFVCKNGHFHLLKLNCCHEWRPDLGLRKTIICTASHDINSCIGVEQMTARLPSLNGLRAFEAAARHLSFTQAASELNVTQTAISHQIKRLEQELGIRLFIRQNRALALTPEARDYLPGVRAAFNDLRLATDRVLRKDNDHVLTVSTLASLAAKWLLPRLSRFQEAQAAIDGIGVAIGRTSYVEADIAKGGLVVPFKITLPADAGFYLVSPEARADSPKLEAFRQWLLASVQNKPEEVTDTRPARRRRF